MKRDLGALTAREHDLVVIGGGIHGLAAAYDAAQRGLSVPREAQTRRGSVVEQLKDDPRRPAPSPAVDLGRPGVNARAPGLRGTRPASCGRCLSSCRRMGTGARPRGPRRALRVNDMSASTATQASLPSRPSRPAASSPAAKRGIVPGSEPKGERRRALVRRAGHAQRAPDHGFCRAAAERAPPSQFTWPPRFLRSGHDVTGIGPRVEGGGELEVGRR